MGNTGTDRYTFYLTIIRFIWLIAFWTKSALSNLTMSQPRIWFFFSSVYTVAKDASSTFFFFLKKSFISRHWNSCCIFDINIFVEFFSLNIRWLWLLSLLSLYAISLAFVKSILVEYKFIFNPNYLYQETITECFDIFFNIVWFIC